MLAPLNPLDAYRTDLDRLHRRSEFGNADTVWLLLAHCLGKLSRIGEPIRDQIALQSANALRDLAESADGLPAESPQHRADLQLMVAGLSSIDTAAGANAVSRACRGFAARMAEAGALTVAYSVIGYARHVASDASDRERGLLVADQARIARQLGELDTAEELYRTAAAIGERATDKELMSRSFLGRGVIARVRGNYPRARSLFRHGLQLAVASGSSELTFFAHQGLTIVCNVTGDFSAGIEHGWKAFALASGDQVREAETLTNLAQSCLDCGYPRAALRAFLSALSRTDLLRIRLSALGGAALAAGKLEDRTLLNRLSWEIVQTAQRSSLPYENAQALYHLSAAFIAVADDISAERYRQEVQKIAQARGYFELVHATERDELTRTAQRAAPRELQITSREVVGSLESFEPYAEESAFIVTPAG